MTKAHRMIAGSALFAGSVLATVAAGHLPVSEVDRWHRQGQEAWRAGQVTSAAQSYRRAIALEPTDGRSYIGLAVLYEAVNRPDLAVEELEQLQRSNPAAPHLACRLAEAYLGAEDVAEARRLGERAVSLEPDCPRALSVYGIALVRSRYSGSAAGFLRRALALAPTDRGIAEVLVEALNQQGSYAEALRVSGPLLATQQRSPRLEYQVGLAYSRLAATEASVAAARQHLAAAAELAPNWFEPRAELGRMYRSLGRRQEAIEAFEAAWRIDPAVPGVAFNLASLYRQTGDPRAAALERRLAALARGGQSVTGLRVRYNQQEPEPRAILQLASAEAASGAPGTALHRLRKLLAQDPVDLSALKLYRRIDQSSRRGAPPYPRPDPL